MQRDILRVIAVLLGFIFLTSVRAENNAQIVYQEPLQKLQIAYPTPSALQKPGSNQASSLRFDAFGKEFDIALKPNRSLLNTGQRVAMSGQLEVYRGEFTDRPNSWVRLVVQNGVPRGILWDGQEMWAVEAVVNATTGAEQPTIYRLEDLHITPGALSCSGVANAENGSQLANSVMLEASALAAQGPGAVSQIDLAVIGDFEFTSDKGANVDAALISRMNNVDGIFSAQLGVQLNVNRIDTYAGSNDPFSDISNSGSLLDELTDFRVSTSTQNANGLSHLFTGRELDGSTVGIAYTEALCSRRFGAGLTQGTHSATLDSLIAAHEIGHNFGAPHDGTQGSACEASPQDFLMAPSLNGSDTFSACSITQMQAEVSSASCITALPGIDVTVVAGGQPAATLLGDTATLSFEVNSVGTDTASGVAVDIVIPSGVNLDSISSSAGSCSSGAGSANCTIGSVTAGSGATVTINVTTTTVGDLDFVASVSADTNDNGNNDQATIRLSSNAAVDLVATAAAAAQVSLNQSVTVRPIVENRASIPATDVTVTVTPGSGITLDSASWAAGTCSISANAATCQASSLAAQSSNAIQLLMTGVTAGSESYAISATAAETDRDTSNNDASGQVTISSGSSNSGATDSESGGGSLGWLSLFVLLLTRRLCSLQTGLGLSIID